MLGSFSDLGFSATVGLLSLKNDTLIVAGGFSTGGKMVSNGAVFTNGNNQPDFNYPEANGWVMCAIPDGNGGWIIGGQFSKVGSQLRNNIAHIDSTGNLTSWSPSPDGRVTNMLLDGTTLYISGYFCKREWSKSKVFSRIRL